MLEKHPAPLSAHPSTDVLGVIIGNFTSKASLALELIVDDGND